MLGEEFGPYAGLTVPNLDSGINSYNLLKNVPKYNGDINVLFLNSQLSKWDNAKVLKLLKENSKLLPKLLEASRKTHCSPPRTRHWDDLRPHTVSWRVISRLVSLNAEYFLRNRKRDDGITMLKANARLAAAMCRYPSDTLDLVVMSSVVKMQLEVLYRLYKAGWITREECAGIAAFLPDKKLYHEAFPYVMAGKYATLLDMIALIQHEKSGVIPEHLFNENELNLLQKLDKDAFAAFLIQEMEYLQKTLNTASEYVFDGTRYPDAGEPELFLLSVAFAHYPAITKRLFLNNLRVEAMRSLDKSKKDRGQGSSARQDSSSLKQTGKTEQSERFLQRQ